MTRSRPRPTEASVERAQARWAAARADIRRHVDAQALATFDAALALPADLADVDLVLERLCALRDTAVDLTLTSSRPVTQRFFDIVAAHREALNIHADAHDRVWARLGFVSLSPELGRCLLAGAVHQHPRRRADIGRYRVATAWLTVAWLRYLRLDEPRGEQPQAWARAVRLLSTHAGVGSLAALPSEIVDSRSMREALTAAERQVELPSHVELLQSLHRAIEFAVATRGVPPRASGPRFGGSADSGPVLAGGAYADDENATHALDHDVAVTVLGPAGDSATEAGEGVTEHHATIVHENDDLHTGIYYEHERHQRHANAASYLAIVHHRSPFHRAHHVWTGHAVQTVRQLVEPVWADRAAPQADVRAALFGLLQAILGMPETDLEHCRVRQTGEAQATVGSPVVINLAKRAVSVVYPGDHLRPAPARTAACMREVDSAFCLTLVEPFVLILRRLALRLSRDRRQTLAPFVGGLDAIRPRLAQALEAAAEEIGGTPTVTGLGWYLHRQLRAQAGDAHLDAGVICRRLSSADRVRQHYTATSRRQLADRHQAATTPLAEKLRQALHLPREARPCPPLTPARFDGVVGARRVLKPEVFRGWVETLANRAQRAYANLLGPEWRECTHVLAIYTALLRLVAIAARPAISPFSDVYAISDNGRCLLSQKDDQHYSRANMLPVGRLVCRQMVIWRRAISVLLTTHVPEGQRYLTALASRRPLPASRGAALRALRDRPSEIWTPLPTQGARPLNGRGSVFDMRFGPFIREVTGGVPIPANFARHLMRTALVEAGRDRVEIDTAMNHGELGTRPREGRQMRGSASLSDFAKFNDERLRALGFRVIRDQS